MVRYGHAATHVHAQCRYSHVPSRVAALRVVFAPSEECLRMASPELERSERDEVHVCAMRGPVYYHAAVVMSSKAGVGHIHVLL